MVGRNDWVMRRRTGRVPAQPSWTDAGAFRHVVTYAVNSTTGASYGNRGEVSYSSTTSVSLRAAIRQLSGQEGDLARQQFPAATHEVKVHYNSNVNYRGRFTFSGTTLHILGPPENVGEENRELICICGSEQ